METKKAYEFARAMKLLARTFNLIVIGIAYTTPLDAKTSELLRSVSDGNLSFENGALYINAFLGVTNKNERLLVSSNGRGRLVLRRLLPSSLTREVMDEIESALAEEPILTVNPTLTATTTPAIDMPIKKVLQALEKLSAPTGILEAKPYCSSISCPKCDSQDIYLYLKCPDCGGILLEKGETLEHFNCGHVAFRLRFERDGKLVCPKCNKELRQIGVDYRQVGVWYKCADGHVAPNVKLQFICATCNQEFDLDNSKLGVKKKYELTEKGRRFITGR
ncbi:MAG: hypothetical protein ACPLIG_02725 [Candidatus Bathyarchaeales archaeon]